MQLATGFWAFKALAGAQELGLFTHLSREGGITILEAARKFQINERPAELLLTACASLGLLEKDGGKYRNSALSEEFLVKGKPYYFGGFVQMLDRRLYPGWGKLSEALRTNRPTTWDPERQKSLFEGEDPEMLATFWEAMHSLSTFTARELGAAIDFRDYSRLLDVGGGSGAFEIELCRRYPNLRATVYDLPAVTEIAAANIAEAGMSERIATASGDFWVDPKFPAGHDVMLFSMIMHDWTEAKDRTLLAKAYRGLPSRGAIVICELLVNDEKTGPPPAALMSLNMLIETEGRNYTSAEYTNWLAEAGFIDIRTIWFNAAGANGAVVGRKP